MELNEIIEIFKDYNDLYIILKNQIKKNEQLNIDKNIVLKEIKKTVVNFYLNTFKFKYYLTNEIQKSIVFSISDFCDLEKKVKEKDGVIKIYPVKENDEIKKKNYEKTIVSIVDYQIQNKVNTKNAFNIFSIELENKLENYKNSLKGKKMGIYYGSIYYMVERILYVIKCIKKFYINSDYLEKIEKDILEYKKKYNVQEDNKENYYGYVDVQDEFYKDYDSIESYYKKILMLEDDLSEVVVAEWKRYLTNPYSFDNNYKYVMHAFTSGLIKPNLMKKACCSLYTKDINNLMYGNCGLIYDIDVDSLCTMCTDDCGSWITNKDKFIDEGCSCHEQLTNLDGDSVWYENPYNSKLIMPKDFEEECKINSQNTKFLYSEIYLNDKARAIGVFYTDKCENVDDVNVYAVYNNLPLVKIINQKNKFR